MIRQTPIPRPIRSEAAHQGRMKSHVKLRQSRRILRVGPTPQSLAAVANVESTPQVRKPALLPRPSCDRSDAGHNRVSWSVRSRIALACQMWRDKIYSSSKRQEQIKRFSNQHSRLEVKHWFRKCSYIGKYSSHRDHWSDWIMNRLCESEKPLIFIGSSFKKNLSDLKDCLAPYFNGSYQVSDWNPYYFKFYLYQNDRHWVKDRFPIYQIS